MSISLQELNARIADETIFINDLLAEINKVIVGQPALIERVLTALLADGHILLEGVPGLAKTLLIKTTAEAIHAHFARIQFTPDLLPADLIGTQVYNPQLGIFAVHRGPLFTNLLLADEINRAPAKVQSALLEAMQERQVTIASKTDRLPDLFMVMATQNPIEQEGTYPLPEAQVDRFMFKLLVDYPAQADERVMLDRMTNAGEAQRAARGAARTDPGGPQVGARSVHGRSHQGLRAEFGHDDAPPGRSGFEEPCSR